jgi:hypothetical protein
MSSSALASARRRRAGTDAISVPQTSTRTNKPEIVEPPTQNQPITPLLVLQQHEIKIKQLESLITKEEDYEELFQQIDEKIDKLFSVNFEVYNNELNAIKSIMESQNTTSESNSLMTNIKSLVEDKIETQTTIIGDFKNAQTQLFNLLKEDTNKVVKILNDNMESKIALITKTYDQREIGGYDNNVVTKLENELNTLKMIVINNQSTILDMSQTINMLKESLKAQSGHIDLLDSKVASLSSKLKDRNPQHDLLSSLMSNSIFGSMNSRCNVPCDRAFCCEPVDIQTGYDRELGDDNTNELVIDEVQMAELLEISNFDTIDINSKPVSNVILSDEVLCNEVVVDEVLCNEVVVDEVLCNEVVVDEVVCNEVVDDEVVSNETSTPNCTEDITQNETVDETSEECGETVGESVM